MGSISLEIPAITGTPVEVRRPPVTAEVLAQRAAAAAPGAAMGTDASTARGTSADRRPPTIPALTPASGVPAVTAAQLEASDREAIAAEIGRRYQVERLLGRGASGAVYLARDVALHRAVALKIVRERDGSEARERFRREARLAAQLSHPGIVPVHSYDERGPIAWLVMQYVSGESLAERLRASGRLTPDETRRILAELSLALEHAHRNGIVHRDLKPENILLERGSGRVLLADFGVAMRHWSDREMASERRAWGTPAYMSPEQALGEPDVDGRSDLYALGLLGFAMLTGRLPFTGSTPAALLASRLSSGAPRVRDYSSDIPAHLAAAIDRCLEPRPERRWQSARQLYVALTKPRRGWRFW
jgi:serine/threonine protein kinase